MYPHERSLVEEMKDKPFALIGVNSDKDVARARKAVADNQLNWRSFHAGPQGAGGPIPKAWAIKGWPTIVVLDGVAFKLSDYKGKVVFLDFWGDW